MMNILGDDLNLTASDSFECPAYVAVPVESARAAVVMLQEMDKQPTVQSCADDASTARLTKERTLAFLTEHLMGPPVYAPAYVIDLPIGIH